MGPNHSERVREPGAVGGLRLFVFFPGEAEETATLEMCTLGEGGFRDSVICSQSVCPGHFAGGQFIFLSLSVIM